MMKNYLVQRMAACAWAAFFCVCGIPVQAYAGEDTGTAKGRFLESEVVFPGAEDGAIIFDMKRTTEGKLQIVTDSLNREGPMTLWESSDLGETWEQTAALPEELNELFFTRMVLDGDGGGAGVGMLFEGEDYETHFVSFDAAGNTQDLLFPEESVDVAAFARDGNTLGRTWGGAAFSLNRETAEIENTFALSDVNQITACGKEALLLTSAEVLRYDMESGEPIEADEALNTALYSTGEEYMDITTLGSPILFDEDEEGRLIYCGHSGIFTHVMDGSTVEQVVDGTLSSLSDPSLNLVAVTEIDGIFFLTCKGSEGGSRILKYAYDPNVAAQPEKEVKIYSLREDSGIRQSITAFQNLHPDTYINYEVGMNGTDGVSISDALRTLNTDILAGNGPDILIMDRMSVETYVGKGLLTDLSDILEEVKEEDGLLENITNTWKNADEIPAVPVGFGVFMAAGKTDLLARLNGKETSSEEIGEAELAEDPAEMPQESEILENLVEVSQEPGALEYTTVAELPDFLYYLCAAGWTKEDHTIDQEKLEAYVSTVKQIYDNTLQNMSESEKEIMDRWWEEESAWLDEWICHGDMGFAGLELLAGRLKLYPGILLDMTTFCTLTSAEEKIGDFENQLFRIDNIGAFYPVCTVGILNTAKEPEASRLFVRYLLSKEGQLGNSYDGFPVNEAAFRERIYTNPYEGSDVAYTFSSENAETGERIELDAKWPKREQLDWLMQSAGSLSVRASNEEVQERVVVEETRRCMKGEISVEETVDSIMQKLNLYLAENGE